MLQVGQISFSPNWEGDRCCIFIIFLYIHFALVLFKVCSVDIFGIYLKMLCSHGFLISIYSLFWKIFCSLVFNQKFVLLESSLLLSFHLFFCSCLGILLQKVDDRAYVRDKIDWMYKQANIAIPSNRLGLAKAMGLVSQSLILINAVSRCLSFVH